MDKNLDSSMKNMFQALSSEKDLVRTKARRALVAAGKEAVPFLIEALKNAEPLVRWEATKALGEIGDTTAAPALVKALEDDDFDVRWLAAEGLIKLNVGGVKPLLQALVIDPYSVSLREAAHHVLHHLATEELRDYLVPVLAALKSISPSAEISVAALRALEMLEQFEETAKGGDDSALRRFTRLDEAMGLGGRRRAHKYAQTLRI